MQFSLGLIQISFSHTGNKTKCAVEFHLITKSLKIWPNVRNGILILGCPMPDLLYAAYSVKLGDKLRMECVNTKLSLPALVC